MKSLVIYDSLHGNTKMIADIIGEAIEGENEVVHYTTIDPSQLKEYDLLVFGVPTHGGGMPEEMRPWVAGLTPGILNGARVAVFDTRMAMPALKIIGFAAPRLEKKLKRKGAQSVISPEGFFVNGAEGPVSEGEIERAKLWGTCLSSTI